MEPTTDIQRELRRRAVHEAGHAVFMWRSGEGEDGFRENFAPFREVIINPIVGGDSESVQPILLEDGRQHDAFGAVVHNYRLTVPQARSITGGTRSQRRDAVARAKRQAGEAIQVLLAGPIVEEYFWTGYEPHFDWSLYLDDEEATKGATINGDMTKAIAIARGELLLSWQRTCALMDSTVDRVETKLKNDKRYLRTIEALADALMQRFRLDDIEAIEVMSTAWSLGQHRDVAA
jgi:hypothetical protein